MKTVRPFKNGNSQAIRIPKAFRFEDNEELIIRREGNAVILESKDQWPEKLLSILGVGEDPLPREPQPELSKIKNSFE
jgi:antitoxin VapB